MKSLKSGDLCRIIQQPSNQIVRLVGNVGFIEEVLDDYANIQTLKLDGSIAGVGSVPLCCLQQENDPQWVKAKELRDQQFNQLMIEGLERGKRWQTKLTEVAEKNSLTKKQVEAIYSELNSFHEYMR